MHASRIEASPAGGAAWCSCHVCEPKESSKGEHARDGGSARPFSSQVAVQSLLAVRSPLPVPVHLLAHLSHLSLLLPVVVEAWM